MGKFGWSYPAGCSGPPSQDDGVTELQDNVLGLLEDAGIPEATNDAIMKLIADAEYALHRADAETAAGEHEDAMAREQAFADDFDTTHQH